MKQIKVYVAKTVEDGLPRICSASLEDCQSMVQEWLFKQIRNKPIQIWEVPAKVNEELNEAEINPFADGKRCSVIFQQTESKYDD
jgi:hypothetical protein